MKTKLWVLMLLSATVFAANDDDKVQYDRGSYGAPQLYYDIDSLRQREVVKELREANELERQQLEIERETLQELKDQNDD